MRCSYSKDKTSDISVTINTLYKKYITIGVGVREYVRVQTNEEHPEIQENVSEDWRSIITANVGTCVYYVQLSNYFGPYSAYVYIYLVTYSYVCKLSIFRSPCFGHLLQVSYWQQSNLIAHSA